MVGGRGGGGRWELAEKNRGEKKKETKTAGLGMKKEGWKWQRERERKNKKYINKKLKTEHKDRMPSYPKAILLAGRQWATFKVKITLRSSLAAGSGNKASRPNNSPNFWWTQALFGRSNKEMQLHFRAPLFHGKRQYPASPTVPSGGEKHYITAQIPPGPGMRVREDTHA